MTPKKQVSPAIRILRGERDASARATHLEAATRKFLVTTNERKQMSTTTNFKRIALVAVAAMGLGLLSSVPAQAGVSSLTATATNGTATTTVSDSTTAATLVVTATLDQANDTVAVQFYANAGTTRKAYLQYVDTSGTSSMIVSKSLTTASAATKVTDSLTASTDVFALGFAGASTIGTVGATFKLILDTAAGLTNIPAGTYSYTALIRAYDNGTVNNTKTLTRTLDVVVGVPAANATAVNGALSSVTLGDTVANLSGTTSTTSDSTIAVAATASTDNAGFVRVRLRNASGGNAQESLTATISAGRIGISGGTMGRSIDVAYTAAMVTNGYVDLAIQPDGTSGTGTITIAATSYTFPTKSVTFYGATTASITAAAYASVIGASGIGVHGSQFDSLNNSWGAGTALYAYSSDTSVISSYGSACTWNSTLKVSLCTLTGVKNGTANITLRDAATVATSTKSSSAVAVKVNINAAATVALEFNKTSYAPGEKATLKIIAKDAAGAVLPAQTYSNLFATGGLTSSASIGSAVSSTVLSNVSVVTMANVAASTDTPLVTLDPIGQVTFYMPLAGGTVTVTGKGGTSLPSAGQVTVSATATVTDSGAAALAAVTALATTVASLKTLITTLTNLVLKIQKKVKA
jgi:trimeric autotransporter adhesin